MINAPDSSTRPADSLLSILIPVYNEETTIEELVRRVFDVDLGGLDREVIVVDDGSQDCTWEIIRGFGNRNSDLLL